MIIGIVAVARNAAIGKNGKLPWHYSADLKFFKRTTVGHAVVMGWNTWAGFGGVPLPNRLNIVLSRSHDLERPLPPSLILLRGKQEVLSLAKYLNCDLFVIGGAQIYGAFASEIERWTVTEIPESVADADAFMPSAYTDGFRLTETIELDETSDLRAKIFERESRTV